MARFLVSVPLALALLPACNGTPAAPSIDGGDLAWNPPGLWLTSAAGSSASGTVTVHNQGGVTATVSSITLSAERPVFTAATGSFEIAGGSSAEVSVTYAPTSCLPDGGEDLGHLVFSTDTQYAPTFALPLVGLCVPASPVADAGPSDAGADAGPADAGADAGPDAGP